MTNRFQISISKVYFLFFANCTMLMLLLKLCEFILGKSSCARRELIVLACMCKVNLKEAKTVFRSIPWVLSFDAHFFLKESPEVGQEYADGRQERGPQVSPTHPLRSPHPPTGTHPSSGPTAPPSCQFLFNLLPRTVSPRVGVQSDENRHRAHNWKCHAFS